MFRVSIITSYFEMFAGPLLPDAPCIPTGGGAPGSRFLLALSDHKIPCERLLGYQQALGLPFCENFNEVLKFFDIFNVTYTW